MKHNQEIAYNKELARELIESVGRRSQKLLESLQNLSETLPSGELQTELGPFQRDLEEYDRYAPTAILHRPLMGKTAFFKKSTKPLPVYDPQ